MRIYSLPGEPKITGSVEWELRMARDIGNMTANLCGAAVLPSPASGNDGRRTRAALTLYDAL